MMDRNFTYLIDKSYLEKCGELLTKTIQGWLDTNKYNVIVSFLTFTDRGELVIDYNEDINNKDIIKNKVEEFLDEFNIEYELDEAHK